VVRYYLDSSAIVKRYVTERGSPWLNSLYPVAEGHLLHTVRISGAEIIAALFLRARAGSITQADARTAAHQFKAEFASRYQHIEVTEMVVDTAMELVERHALRGYDAVQLAAGLLVDAIGRDTGLSPLVFISADRRLLAAASNVGLLVDDPNEHP
jgi:predicted nucleic acid-binding protein